jgi:uncharacterized damage-inducible protein DinB
MSTALIEIFKHNLWANLRILDACEKVTDEQLETKVLGTYDTIKSTLKHLFGAEERYLFRLTGDIPEPQLREIEGFPGFDVLRDHARRSGEGFIRLVSGAEPTEDIIITNDQGTEAIAPALLLVQAINHATEHRTHILTILGQHGIELLEDEYVDGWAYGWSVDPPLVRSVTA